MVEKKRKSAGPSAKKAKAATPTVKAENTTPPPAPQAAEESEKPALKKTKLNTPSASKSDEAKPEIKKEIVAEAKPESEPEPLAETAAETAEAEENDQDPQEDNNDAEFSFEKEDVDNLLEIFSKEELLSIVKKAFDKDNGLLSDVSESVSKDPSKRKVFVRGLSWETTSETLRERFGQYGEIEKAEVVKNKADGKSRGYGFVTFKTLGAALKAVREPSKKIDNRVTVAHLSLSSPSSGESGSQKKELRKIYVAGLPEDVDVDHLVKLFSQYGEIEEGPLGFDKESGKCKGFTFFIYKTAEGAKKALEQPSKKFDDFTLTCKYGETKSKKEAPSKSPAAKTPVTISAPVVPQVILGGGHMMSPYYHHHLRHHHYY